jgi:protein-disulfide isomerase
MKTKSITALLFVVFSFLSFSARAAHVIQAGQTPKVKMLIYGDYQCPFTAKIIASIERLRADYPQQVGIYFAHFPLSFHDQAVNAAIAATCADRQKLFWSYSKALFQNQAALSAEYYPRLASALKIRDITAFENCLQDPAVKSAVELEYAVGEAQGINGTPNTFINGELVKGAYPLSHYKEIIERELAK